MRKKLMALSLFFATLVFAGPKEDYENAVKNYSKTKNEKVFKDELLKITKVKDLSQDLKVMLYQNLYYIEKDINKKISYLETLEKLEPKQINFKLLLITDYKLAKKESNSKSLYDKTVKGLTKQEKEAFDTLLSKLLFNSGLKNDAEKMAKDLLKSNEKIIKAEANKLLSLLNISNQKVDKALEYILEASKLTEGKDLETETILLNIYVGNNKLEKAYDVALKLARNLKDGNFYPEAILISEKLKKDSQSLVNEYKNIVKPEQKSLINLALSEVFAYNGLLDVAIKYAEKALKEDKKNEAYYILAVSYANKNDKAKALKYVKDAKKAKVKGIEALEKEINEKMK